jgi:3'-phosphoadenosine 5'-phosphosulfate sulfotransferase (PAPS reductase)/FAD synthetase
LFTDPALRALRPAECRKVAAIEQLLAISHLRALEAESIYIMREVAAKFSWPVMLYCGEAA